MCIASRPPELIIWLFVRWLPKLFPKFTKREETLLISVSALSTLKYTYDAPVIFCESFFPAVRMAFVLSF